MALTSSPHRPNTFNRTRRAFIGAGVVAGTTGLIMWPEAKLLAQQVGDFIEGAPMPDIAPVQLSKHVWTIFATDGFPTPENHGMMSNVSFVVTSAGVVVLDSGSSVQIGRMAIRTDQKSDSSASDCRVQHPHPRRPLAGQPCLCRSLW